MQWCCDAFPSDPDTGEVTFLRCWAQLANVRGRQCLNRATAEHRSAHDVDEDRFAAVRGDLRSGALEPLQIAVCQADERVALSDRSAFGW